MSRKLFSVAAALSFLLSVTAVTLWCLGVDSRGGDERLDYHVYTYPYGWMADGSGHTSFPLPNGNVGDTNRPVLAIWFYRTKPSGDNWFNLKYYIKVNVWWLAGVVLVPPLWWFVKYCKYRLTLSRLTHAICSRCNYNLTGNTSGTCPECGEAITPSTPNLEPESHQPD